MVLFVDTTDNGAVFVGNKEITEFESELARNLVLAQDKLLRTKLRLDVLEMVQVFTLLKY